MKNSFTVLLENKIEALEKINGFIHEIATKSNWSDSLVFKSTIITEEFFTNTVKYGFQDQKLHEIELVISDTDMDIEIEIIDDGMEFNPLEMESPDTEALAEDRIIGGLGIHLSRNLSREIKYKREDNKNHIKILVNKGD
jgi:serine/threonine-protein kinase RsbW